MSETSPTRTRPEFAVVVPALDEAQTVPELIAELRMVFDAHALQGEVIFVDDGSTDGSAELATRIAAGWPAFRVLRHERNLGKTEALLTASAATEAEWLILFDADLQYSPRELPRFVQRLREGWDVVTARKRGRYEKQLVSTIYNQLSRLCFGVPVSDLNSMKGFRRSLLSRFPLKHDWHRYLVVLAHTHGATMTELDVPLFPRRHGQSRYGSSLRIVTAFLDLLAVASFLIFRVGLKTLKLTAAR